MATVKKPKEGDLVRACLDFLAVKGIMAWRNNSGGLSWTDKRGKDRWMAFGKVGSPDIIAVLKPSGRFLGVECKLPKTKQSDAQVAFQEALEQAGGIYVLARTLDDVHDALKCTELQSQKSKKNPIKTVENEQ